MVTKAKKPSKKVLASHDKAKAELRKMANKHNDKVMKLGSKQTIDGKVYILNSIHPHLRDLKIHANIMIELNKVKEVAYEERCPSEYGYELWVR